MGRSTTDKEWWTTHVVKAWLSVTGSDRSLLFTRIVLILDCANCSNSARVLAAERPDTVAQKCLWV